MQVAGAPTGAFVNDAGWIANIAFGEFRCVGLIYSKAGSWRSKHFHKTDSHVLYVVSGEMHYWERDLDGEHAPEPVIVRPGESYYTGPLLVHKTFFPVDTVLISASKNPRDHASHESDVVRIEEP